MRSPELELYFFEECPYCQRVLAVIQKLNIKVTFSNIHNDINQMHKLHQITGRKTVPCLFINGEPMFESGDIKAWLEKNSDQLTKNT